MKGYFRTTTKGGYTIIETMISISVFTVVVIAGMGALLGANAAHKKSEDMRTILDNLSFIMEDMSRNLRTGEKYQCLPKPSGAITLGPPQNCADGWGIAFGAHTGTFNDNPSSYNDQWVYKINSGYIEKSTAGATQSNFVKLTPCAASPCTAPGEVYIDPAASGFSVLGAPKGSADTQQPFVIIRLVGTITYKSVTTPFYLQTSVSQRKLDV